MNDKATELRERTHRFFVRVIALCDSLPQSVAATSIAQQLVDSAGSTDSNYRAACRARSTKEFIAKIGVAAEEADESQGWLRALISSRIATTDEAKALETEADDLTRIFVKSGKTAAQNLITAEAARQQPRPSRSRR